MSTTVKACSEHPRNNLVSGCKVCGEDLAASTDGLVETWERQIFSDLSHISGSDSSGGCLQDID